MNSQPFGNMTPYPGSSATSWDTLEEPIWDTISRDISSIGLKLKFILLPMPQPNIYVNICKNWDLWGPFLFSAYIAFSLNNCGEECTGYHQSNFSSLFVLLWMGNIFISLNYKLVLSRRVENTMDPSKQTNNFSQENSKVFPMSIFQLLCLFGYCLAIPSLGILLIQIISLFSQHSKVHFYEKFVITAVFIFIYPVVSALRMIVNNSPREKTLLVAYPVVLFFFMLSLYSFSYVY